MYDLDWQLREKRNGAKHPRGFFVVVIGLLCVRRCRRARNAPPPRRVTSARSWSAWVATGWVGARKRRGHYPGLTTSISIITSIILLLLLFSFNACFPLFGTFFSLLMMNGALPLPVLTCFARPAGSAQTGLTYYSPIPVHIYPRTCTMAELGGLLR